MNIKLGLLVFAMVQGVWLATRTGALQASAP